LVVRLYVSAILSYGRKQFPLEALNAGADRGKPFSQPGAASACCSGIVTATNTITTPSNASAATIAIIAMDAVVFSSFEEWFILAN
jgi:hypothetical protein